MQFLIFHLGNDRYGLSTHRLVRVLPLVELKQIPQTPAHVAGLMNYHGTSVPVIDLGMLACERLCVAHLDTRILLTNYRADDGVDHLLGLMVERVAEVAAVDPGRLAEPGVATPDAPYLGRVLAADGAILQLVELDHVLTPAVRALLFPPDTTC